MTSPLAPIGVFDSGIGGLSVLQALRHELPHEHFVYLADSSHAPYGEKGDAFVQTRTLAITQHLRNQHGIKALVVACNTATTAAVQQLREVFPDLPVVGVEPAVKPSAQSSQTGHVGIFATRGTVHSHRFEQLLQLHGVRTQFHVQACDGLARAIEDSTNLPDTVGTRTPDVLTLCERYIQALGLFGLKTGEIDTLVLGCTHYVFVKDILRELLGPDIHVIDTSAAVARQTRRVLEKHRLLQNEPPSPFPHAPHSPQAQDAIGLYTTGSLHALQAASERWLHLPPTACALTTVPEHQSSSSEPCHWLAASPVPLT